MKKENENEEILYMVISTEGESNLMPKTLACFYYFQKLYASYDSKLSVEQLTINKETKKIIEKKPIKFEISVVDI